MRKYLIGHTKDDAKEFKAESLFEAFRAAREHFDPDKRQLHRFEVDDHD